MPSKIAQKWKQVEGAQPFLKTGEFLLHSHLYHILYGGTIPAYNWVLLLWYPWAYPLPKNSSGSTTGNAHGNKDDKSALICPAICSSMPIIVTCLCMIFHGLYRDPGYELKVQSLFKWPLGMRWAPSSRNSIGKHCTQDEWKCPVLFCLK